MKTVLLVIPPFSGEELYGKLAAAASAEPPLGVSYLAANLVQHGFAVEILDAATLRLSLAETVEAVQKCQPLFVGLSAVTLSVRAAGQVAGLLKADQVDFPIVIGGVHVTALPMDTMQRFPGFDIGVVGEAEETVVELANAIAKGQAIESIQGLIARNRHSGQLTMTGPRPFIADLDSLPLPAWELLPYLPRYYHAPAYATKSSPSSSLITTRGCGFECTFCFQGTFGRKVRAHSADYVMRMIRHLYQRYGIRDIRIMDDNFMLSKQRLQRICEMLRKERLALSWSCLARVDSVTPELLTMMRQAGCYQIAFGIESGSQAILDFVHKRITLDKVREALELVHRARMKTLGYFMLGFPHETTETIEATIEFARRVPLDDFKMQFVTPFPGSPLWQTAVHYGSFDPQDWQRMNTDCRPCFIPHGLTEAQLLAYQKKAFRKFYLRPRIIFSYMKLALRPRNWGPVCASAMALAGYLGRKEHV